MGSSISWDPWPRPVARAAVGIVRSVHKSAKMAPRRRFGAFVYTVATRVAIRIATRAAPGGTSASTTMACRRRLLAGPSRLGGKTGSARAAPPRGWRLRRGVNPHELTKPPEKTAICTRRMARGRLLPPCHARGRVERVFEIARQGGRALPVCVRSEGTLGGHLLMCLVATAATRMMSDVLASCGTSPRSSRCRGSRASGTRRGATGGWPPPSRLGG